MKDKPFFKRLRILMAAGSIAGFVGGWALLSQTYQVNTGDAATVAQVIPASPTSVSPTVTPIAARATSVATTAPTATATPLVQITTVPQATTTNPSTQTRLRTGGS